MQLCRLVPIGSAIAALAITAVPVRGQEAPPTAAVPIDVSIVPAGTSVMLKFIQPISSKTAKRGDRFPLELVNDVWAAGRIVIPKGSAAVGEVVHAAKTGFGGRAGELILAARYLKLGDAEIRLRGFKVGKTGANNTAEALAVTNVAPIIGIFVTGSSAFVERGQIGMAKISEDFSPPPVAADQH